VHFSNAQLFWECKSKAATEDGMLAWQKGVTSHITTLNSLPGALASRDEMNQAWDLVVESYSARTLTFRRDKLSALAGMISHFQEIMGDTPLIGLWRQDLPAGLLWVIKSPRQVEVVKGEGEPNDLLGIPSWSWCSVDGPVSYLKNRRGSVAKMELLEAKVAWSGTALTSQICEAKLVVQGALTAAHFEHDSNDTAHVLVDFPDLPKNYSFREFTLDPGRKLPEPGGWGSCLLVSSSSYRQKYDPVNSCLISIDHVILLAPTRALNTFRRIGAGILKRSSTSFFEYIESTIVTLV
jgi:hypothetical protein